MSSARVGTRQAQATVAFLYWNTCRLTLFFINFD